MVADAALASSLSPLSLKGGQPAGALTRGATVFFSSTHTALAAAAAAAGACATEVRATVHHLVVVGGYAHCLAATNALVACGVRVVVGKECLG